MKEMFDQISKMLERIDILIDSREGVFYDRSDEWQVSDKGVGYFESIDELNEVKVNLEITLESIEIYLES